MCTAGMNQSLQGIVTAPPVLSGESMLSQRQTKKNPHPILIFFAYMVLQNCVREGVLFTQPINYSTPMFTAVGCRQKITLLLLFYPNYSRYLVNSAKSL